MPHREHDCWAPGREEQWMNLAASYKKSINTAQSELPRKDSSLLRPIFFIY
jgi:hypothetical protein